MVHHYSELNGNMKHDDFVSIKEATGLWLQMEEASQDLGEKEQHQGPCRSSPNQLFIPPTMCVR